MAQIDDLQNFVNVELPRRRVLLKSSDPDVSYDGDPNSGSAPAIIQGSPLGTWYFRAGTDQFYKRHTSAWVEEGSGGGGSVNTDIFTITDLTIPVDFNDGSAVDPTPGIFFSTQTEIDDFLAANSATNFKHLGRVFDVLPPIILHDVNINIAAGVQYADPSESAPIAFELGRKLLLDGEIFINGTAPANYTQVVAPVTIQSFSNASNNPTMGFSGTPFAGQNLKGLFAVTSDGFTGMIHDHDDSNLFVTQGISPAPTPSVSTVFIGRPGTVLRNATAAAPTTQFKGQGCFRTRSSSLFSGRRVNLNDLQLDHLGGIWAWHTSEIRSDADCVRCLIDHEDQRVNLGITPNGRGWQTTGRLFVDTSAVRSASGQGAGVDEPGFVSGQSGINSRINFVRSYLGEESQDGVFCFVINRQGRAELFFRGTVIDGIASTSTFAAVESGGGSVRFDQPVGSEVIDQVKDTVTALRFGTNGEYGRTEFTQVIISGCSGPCIEMTRGNIVDQTDSGLLRGFKDGGGNLDVGFQISAEGGNFLNLDVETDITGALGDMRVEGVIASYADLEAITAIEGALRTEKGNTLAKIS